MKRLQLNGIRIRKVCRQVDNIDLVYSLDRLRSMYDFLSTHGECFYVRYKGQLIGDISLRDDSEIAIVICREYQNRHIGRRCVLNMFQSIGFRPSEEEWYIYDIE